MLLQQPASSPTLSNTQTPVKMDYDLVVVGGGIVGATLACSLKNSGLQVALIEPQPQAVAVARRQAYALTLQTGRILDGIGIWSEILPKITTFRQISLSDSDHPGIVEFLPEDLGTEELGYVGEHHIILGAMHRFLEACDHVHWICPAQMIEVQYHPDYATTFVKQDDTVKPIYSRIVVAADGSRSALRQAAGIGTTGWKYWQSCVAMTIQTEKPHNNIAFERFWPSGPMGVLPLPGNRCQVVWTAPHSEAQALKEMDQAAFLKLLQHRTGGLLGQLELLSDRYVFPVQLMQSNDYVQPRLVLVGDAAHACHPVGGQGLNMGIRDAAAIAQVLKTAQQNGEDIGSLSVLKRYQRWRKKENWIVLGLTDFLDRMFSGDWKPKVIARRLGLSLLRKIKPLRYLALRLMTGLIGRPIFPKNI
ncbi:MAG: FAD-dependent hydroxylase [Microcoleaceae cyanobacterium]